MALVQIANMGLIAIYVSDLDRAEKFYTNVLGFERVEIQQMSPGVTLQTAGVEIYLNEDRKEREPGYPPVTYPEIGLSFVVHGVRASYERMRDAGVVIVGDYNQPWDGFASVQIADPDGNLLELMGPP